MDTKETKSPSTLAANAGTKLKALAERLLAACSEWDLGVAARLAWLYSQHAVVRDESYDIVELTQIVRFVEDLDSALENYTECFRPPRGRMPKASEDEQYEIISGIRQETGDALDAMLALVDAFWEFDRKTSASPTS